SELHEHVEARLLRSGTWEVCFRPNNMRTQALIGCEGLICTLDAGSGVSSGACGKHDSGGLGVAVTSEAENDCIFDLRLLAEGGLKVGGIDFHPFRRDDDILLPSFEMEKALRIELAEVAGVEPSLFARDGLELATLPVVLCDILAADEDLAGAAEFDVA